MAASKRWTRFTRVSLRTTMILFTALCLTLGLWSHAARRQASAVRVIVDLGSSVTYEPRVEELWAPAWLIEWVGKDYFIGVTGVQLTRRRDGRRAVPLSAAELDRAVAAMVELRRLSSLYLADTGISDDDLASLEPIGRKIESLQIQEQMNHNWKGSGLRHLAGFTRLKELSCHADKLDSQSFQTLCALPRLESIYLGVDEIDEAAFGCLAGCRSLKLLGIAGARFRASGVRRLSEAPALKSVTLMNVMIDEHQSVPLEKKADGSIGPVEDWVPANDYDYQFRRARDSDIFSGDQMGCAATIMEGLLPGVSVSWAFST